MKIERKINAIVENKLIQESKNMNQMSLADIRDNSPSSIQKNDSLIF